MLVYRKESLLVVLSLLLVFLTAGCSRQLDRGTAEKLIQASGQPGEQSLTFELHTPVDKPPGSMGSQAGRSNDQTRFDFDFADKLAKVGILSWLPETWRPGAGGFGHVIVRPFTGIPQEMVTWKDEGSSITGPFRFGTLTLTLASPQLNRVTGITQEAAAALAEAEIGLRPTALYDRIEPQLRALLARCSSFPDPKPNACREWPTQQALASTKTARFNFRKFDDGWRLVQ